MRKRQVKRRKWLIGLTLVTAIAACSAGGGDEEGAPVVMSGVMRKGSVILNGAHFLVADGALITIDDIVGAEDGLRDGMVVSVKGTLNDDGTGTLEKLDAEDELQGPVEAVDPAAGSLQVLSQTIHADDRTLYGNLPGGLAGLTVVTDYVEVHGLRDSGGAIRATRVEKLGGSPEVEIKGVIANLTGSTLDIHGLTLTHSGAVIVPAGTVLSNGMRVEAELSGTTATRIEVEDLTGDPALKPAEGAELRIQGYVADLLTTPVTINPATMKVAGQTVKTTSTTTFENGSVDDLADDVLVEVEGVIVGGVVMAAEVEFDRVRIKIEGDISAFTSDTLTVFGLTVHKTGFTEGAWPAATGRFRLKVYGDAAATALYAEKIESAGAGDDILQAPVQARTGSPTYTATLLGIDVALSGADFENQKEVSIPIGQFFTALSPAAGIGGTLIKVKGSYGAGIFTATEAEIKS